MQLASMKHGPVTIASARPQNADHVLPSPITSYKLTGKGDFLSFALASSSLQGTSAQFFANGDIDVAQESQREPCSRCLAVLPV